MKEQPRVPPRSKRLTKAYRSVMTGMRILCDICRIAGPGNLPNSSTVFRRSVVTHCVTYHQGSRSDLSIVANGRVSSEHQQP